MNRKATLIQDISELSSFLVPVIVEFINKGKSSLDINNFYHFIISCDLERNRYLQVVNESFRINYTSNKNNFDIFATYLAENKGIDLIFLLNYFIRSPILYGDENEVNVQFTPNVGDLVISYFTKRDHTFNSFRSH